MTFHELGPDLSPTSRANTAIVAVKELSRVPKFTDEKTKIARDGSTFRASNPNFVVAAGINGFFTNNTGKNIFITSAIITLTNATAGDGFVQAAITPTAGSIAGGEDFISVRAGATSSASLSQTYDPPLLVRPDELILTNSNVNNVASFMGLQLQGWLEQVER